MDIPHFISKMKNFIMKEENWKNFMAFLLGALASTSLCLSLYFILDCKKITKIHQLKFPLLLTSDADQNGISLLPKGTVLYFDKAFPEGFTRYKVYINIDRMPLNLKDLDDPTLISPLEASPLDKPSLQKLLQSYPLSKDDLTSILKSNKISKDEIKEIFENYLSKD
ncbi:putative transmembrane protein [Janthinobacterium agaricidamnosum NBRC 102515 = DSM 9628]|uniref:Putative transmembrane protein n=2 Tax=Janthinobacterium agaricidamnosum TaxID=55508 RepID=W0V6G2_9BURK|nr:putative transmembrane protein [Janthinobacterium agaricidamnosum NBRC 102515 = DSM 9628]